jgi:hypothetical protein
VKIQHPKPKTTANPTPTMGYLVHGMIIWYNPLFFGAPALRKAQFAQAIPQSYMSIHLTINAPPPLVR